MDIHLLTSVAKAQTKLSTLSREKAIQQLGILKNNEAAKVLVALLEDEVVAEKAYDVLSKSVYIFDAYYAVAHQHKKKNPWATKLLKAWARKEWLIQKIPLPESLSTTIFKVPYTVTAEMMSPSKAAWNRLDVPLHAQSFLENTTPTASQEIQTIKSTGYPITFVANQIDFKKASALQCQAAVRSLLWHIGKTQGVSRLVKRGIVLSQRMDDRFYEIAENLGILLLTLDTEELKTKEAITIWPYQNKVSLQNGKSIFFEAQKCEWQSIWRAESGIEFLLGCNLAFKAKTTLEEVFLPWRDSSQEKDNSIDYTLAQKIIGKACNLKGIQAKEECIPILSTVALSSSQYSEHWMDQPKGYSADLVIYQHLGLKDPSLENLMLKPSDGKLHAWMHRLMLTDSINLSHDHYMRSPFGVSLPSTENNEKAALMGALSIKMPSSILVKFYGTKRSDIRLRDMINAMTYFILKKNILSRQNDVFSWDSPILEIEGLSFLTPEEAYEFTENSGIYKTSACSFELSLERVIQAVEKNVEWLKGIIQSRYSHHNSLLLRLEAMQAWLLKPHLLKRDCNPPYQKTFEISLDEIDEPILASISDPTQVLTLSELNQKNFQVNEVWIGSTAIQLDHYRVVASLLKKYSKSPKIRLWLAPPSPLELKQLMQEGYYQVYGERGVYTEMPEEALCTQSRFKPGSRIVTTSLHTFQAPYNSLCDGYITSPEIATLTAILGRLPSLSEYRVMVGEI